MKIAGQARTAADCYLAIEYLLESLRAYGDHHSFFMRADEVEHWENQSEPDGHITFPTIELTEQIAHIVVPPFHGGNTELMVAYADSLQVGMQRAWSPGLKGWVVDLRENTGGNMEPMIVGLGPLFDEGALGTLVDVEGQSESWYYNQGTYYWEEEAGIKASRPVVLTKRLPIAVLTSARTGSSGEIVAISFIGNSQTRSFGQATWGLTTGNGDFDLADNSRMFLASTKMADRHGVVYTSRILPDVVIDPATSTTGDAVLELARQWISEQ